MLLNQCVIPLGLLLITTVVISYLLRGAGIVRVWLVSGFIAGIILGPSLAGRVFPEMQVKYFVGGEIELQAIQDLQIRQAADNRALLESGVSPEALEELKSTHLEEMNDVLAEYESAKKAHQHIMLGICTLVVCVVFGLRIPMNLPGTGEVFRQAVFLFAWMTVLVTGSIATIAVYGLQSLPLGAVCLGLAYATVAVPRSRNPGIYQKDNPNHARIKHLHEVISSATFMSWLCASIIIVVVLISQVINPTAGSGLSGSSSTDNVYAGNTYIMVLAISGILSGIIIRFTADRFTFIENIIKLASSVLIAVVTGFCVLQIDILSTSMIGPFLIGAVIGGDGRWFGAATALRLQGLPWRNAWMSSLRITEAGLIQVAVAYMFWVEGILGANLLLAALVGAVACDITYTVRVKMTLAAYGFIVKETHSGISDIQHDIGSDAELYSSNKNNNNDDEKKDQGTD